MKRCIDCGEVKPRSEFYMQSKKTGHLRAYCKPCSHARTRRWKREHPDRAREVSRESNRRGYASRRTVEAEKRARYSRENRAVKNAHKQVFRAIERGDLVRPACCERCGRETAVDAHHLDYNKPLDVRWLCRPCHSQEHREVAA